MQTPTQVPTDMAVYELNWGALICCLEEHQIVNTIPPVALALDLDKSAVSIASYKSAISYLRRRALTFDDGGWKILYKMEVAGINATLNLQTQLNNDTFVENIGESISTSMDLNLDSIRTVNVTVIPSSTSPTLTPSEPPTTLPTFVNAETVSVTALSLLLVVIVGIGFLVISICALKYDYKAIKVDRSKPLVPRSKSIHTTAI